MGCYALAHEQWTVSTCLGEMLVQQVLQSIVTQRGSARGWKGWLERLTSALVQPTAQHENGVFAQRRVTSLAALALASRVRAGAEHDVRTAKAGELCSTQPRLDGQHQKRPITAP